MTIKILLNALICLVFGASSSFASIVLSGVTTKRIGTDFFIELSFDGILSEKDVQINYVNDAINVSVAGAKAGKRHFKLIKDTSISEVTTMPGPESSTQIKVSLTKNLNGSQFEKTTSFVIQTNQLLLRVGDPTAPMVASQDQTGDLIDKLMKQENAPAAAPAKVQAAAVADESAPVFKTPVVEVKEKTTSTTTLVLRMLMSLLLVGAIFGGGLYALKKWPGAKTLKSRSRMIEILAQHALGPKKSVAVIRVAGETVLVGVTDNHISILKTLALLDEEKFQSALQSTVATVAKNSKPIPESPEDFSMRGLKEIVNDRLKNMRSMN